MEEKTNVVEIESDDSGFMAEVDRYCADLTLLKFTEREYDRVLTTGLLDKDTLKIMVEEMNNQIEEYTRDPDNSFLKDDKERRDYVINILKIKESAENYHESVKDLDIPKILEEMFPLVYAKYPKMKTSFLIREFSDYIYNRFLVDKGRLFYEIVNPKKIKELAQYATERIFNKIEKFSIGHFNSLIFDKNKTVFKQLLETDGDITYKQVEPLVVIFITFFTRFLYKKYPIEKGELLSRRLVITFLKEVNETSADEELRKLFEPEFLNCFTILKDIITAALTNAEKINSVE